MTRPDVNAALQEGNRGGAGPESHRLRGLLVIAQVALSLLLLAGAGLLIKSFANLNGTDPGLDPARVLTADFVLPRGKYPEPAQQRQFFQRFLPQLAALPGIESSGGASPLPFSDNDSANSFWIASPDPRAGNHPDASNLTVAGDYFRTLRIPLLAGRFFGSARYEGRTASRDRERSAGAEIFPECESFRPASFDRSGRDVVG